MKILKITILILLTALTSCQKDEVLPLLPKAEIKKELPQWLNIPNGFASFVQFDYNNDKVDDVVMFEGYDVNVAYNWPGPTFYNGNPLTKTNLLIDNKKIFGSKLIAADFDGDGYKDIFVQSGMDPSGTDWATCWYCDPILPNNIMFNNAGKSFSVKELTEWKGIWRTASAGDSDKDGDIDFFEKDTIIAGTGLNDIAKMIKGGNPIDTDFTQMISRGLNMPTKELENMSKNSATNVSSNENKVMIEVKVNTTNKKIRICQIRIRILIPCYYHYCIFVCVVVQLVVVLEEPHCPTPDCTTVVVVATP